MNPTDLPPFFHTIENNERTRFSAFQHQHVDEFDPSTDCVGRITYQVAHVSCSFTCGAGFASTHSLWSIFGSTDREHAGVLPTCQLAARLRVAPHNTNSSSPGDYSTRLCPAGRTEEGSNANVVYWLRLVPVVFIIVSGVLHHFRCCLPHIRTPRWYLFLVGFVGALIGTSFTYGCSFLIGFPVPSNLVLLSGTLLPFTLLLMGFLWRLAIRADPTLKKDVFRQVFVLLGQAVMTYAYAIYFFVFTQLPPIGQNAFTLMLPLLKLALKNYFSFMLRQLDDLKPAFVVLNVDVFSALYVASILQASQSRVNTTIVLAVDVVQMAIAVDDLCVVMSEIQSLVRLDKFNGSVLDLCIMASRLTGARKELDRRTSSSRTMSNASKHNRTPAGNSAVIEPRREVAATPSVAVFKEALVSTGQKPDDAVRLVNAIAKLLYMVEFLLLIEFAEVMIPIIYCIYLGTMLHLANRAFYPQLAALDVDELILSIKAVMLNAGLEFISFIFICWLIKRRLQLRSYHLLGFALEAQQELVHSSLIVWLVYVIQQSLAHSGMLHISNVTQLLPTMHLA